MNITNPGTQLVVVGLQEIEMGGSSVAMAAAKDVLSYRMQVSGRWGRERRCRVATQHCSKGMRHSICVLSDPWRCAVLCQAAFRTAVL